MLFRKSISILFFIILSAGCVAGQQGQAAQPKEIYLKADGCYKKLRNNPKKMKYREFWLRCAKKYYAVYEADPNGDWAAAGLFKSANLYIDLYKRSYRKADKLTAIDRYKQIISDYPRSRYKQKAQKELDLHSPKKTTSTPTISKTQIITQKKTAHVKKEKPPPLKPKKSGNHQVTVEGVRYWSNPNYTRIVVDASDETQFSHRLLKRDPANQLTERLYVDLAQTVLKRGMEKSIPINDNLLSAVRTGQYTLDTVRIVIDIKSFKNYKIFSLKNPFRIVVDVWGENRINVKNENKPGINTNKKILPSALAKQLALGVSHIVIDPGHGGRDFGAPGYIKGIHEKKVTLQLAKKLAKKIRDKLKCKVTLTRTKDKYLTLEERTAIANTQNADLFISIHTNAANSSKVHGIETYYLNLATDDDSILLAARENATSTKNISDLQTILNDLMQNAKINESARLANFVQGKLYYKLKKIYSRVRNNGVKQAPFYVLLGAQMPAILVETSFISNKRECKRLINEKYQNKLCDAILEGVKRYMLETNPTAIFDPKTRKGSS